MIRADELYNLGRNSTGVRQKVGKLLAGIRECAENRFFSDMGVMVHAESEEDILGHIVTPAARGRLRLGWIGAPGDLSGVIHVERRERNERGDVVWKNVLAILVPRIGDLAYMSPGQDQINAAIDGGSGPITDREWVALSLISYFLSDFRNA